MAPRLKSLSKKKLKKKFTQTLAFSSFYVVNLCIGFLGFISRWRAQASLAVYFKGVFFAQNTHSRGYFP